MRQADALPNLHKMIKHAVIWCGCVSVRLFVCLHFHLPAKGTIPVVKT